MIELAAAADPGFDIGGPGIMLNSLARFSDQEIPFPANTDVRRRAGASSRSPILTAWALHSLSVFPRLTALEPLYEARHRNA